jgi:hypothetical protein
VSDNLAPLPKRLRWGRLVRSFILFYAAVVFFFLLLALITGPMQGSGMKSAWNNRWMQTSHSLYLAMFQYSVDNDGDFPDGKSSTEVFQKLMDGKYVTDPTLFYIPLPGKTEPVQGEPLKPENVSWDVTCCVGANDAEELPLIFMTGYKVAYIPGGAAAPLIKPFPLFGLDARTWIEWIAGKPSRLRNGASPGIAVAYKGGLSLFVKMDEPNDVVPNFIAPTFDPKGKTYRQLTPDGPLP